jgi:hypothetical protein
VFKFEFSILITDSNDIIGIDTLIGETTIFSHINKSKLIWRGCVVFNGFLGGWKGERLIFFLYDDIMAEREGDK